ncbi:hypothetical protein P9112_005781 [Eukaryota sp. TZLM1-RC]
MVDNTRPDGWFLKCKDPTCTFELLSTWIGPGRRFKSSKVATVTQPNFKMNAFSSHTCFRTISNTNKAANAEYIANMASNDSVYKVVWFENSTHTVDFISKKYCCNGWKNDGYPCTPSLAVYLKKHVVLFDGIAKIHSLEYYKKSYERVAVAQDDWLSLFQQDNAAELIDVDDDHPDSNMENHFDLLNDDVA